MAWDSKASRRRQNSAAASGGSRNIAIHTRQQSRQVAQQPQSQHVTDPFLHDFLAPSFDPAEYLNSTLPPLQPSLGPSTASRSVQGAVPLAELSAQAQTTLSQLNAHTTRLTNTLTQLTDDILRSGSRLAYEVELLRGETLSLAETLTDGLRDDMEKFVPGGLQTHLSQRRRSSVSAQDAQETQRRLSILPAAEPPTPDGAPETVAPDEPSYITQLRTLTVVRSRLDSVIKTFGEAMEFVFPPSELSVSSSFLSVSAPDPGPESHSTEEKGQQVLQKLRDEISRLLNDNDDPIKGIEEAARRIEALKELNLVWKGTAEERGRTKFIDGLARMVEAKHQDLLRDMEQAGRRDGRKSEAANNPKQEGESQATESRGYGLMSQLQKLRSGLER